MCCALSFPIQYCKQNCSNHSRYLKIMVEDGFLSSANISAALLCMDGAMDDIPLFCPASTQAWRAYHCSKKLSLFPWFWTRILPKYLQRCLATTVPWMIFPSSVLLVLRRGRLTTISNIIILELDTVTVNVTCHISPRVIKRDGLSSQWLVIWWVANHEHI